MIFYLYNRRLENLIECLVPVPNLDDSIRLYQIFFTDYRTPYTFWNFLGDGLKRFSFQSSAFLASYFQFGISSTPEKEPLQATLFVLERLVQVPRHELMMEFGSSPIFAVGVTSVVARRFKADENMLITFAASSKFSVRRVLLSFLREVNQSDNKKRLLTDGYHTGLYANKLDYKPSAFYAAVYGDLLFSLKSLTLDQDMIRHCSRILGIMCQVHGGSSSWKTIIDYGQCLGVTRLLWDRLTVQASAFEFYRELRYILYFLAHAGEIEASWDEEGIACLYEKDRSCFSEPWLSSGVEPTDWLYWKRPVPTLAGLLNGSLGLEEFRSILEVAAYSDGDEEIESVVDCATVYLCLDDSEDSSRERKEEFLMVRMPGVCSGGLAGVTDPSFGSAYGQLLLQIAQKLEDRKPIGLPVLATGRFTDYPHLPKTEAEALLQWDDIPRPFHIRSKSLGLYR